MQAVIEQQVLGGEQLDVSWNLTLAANLISADVPYGKIEEIEAIDGVAAVVLETLYEPCVVERDEVSNPNMSTSPSMIGSSAVYASGYTGAGSRIAVIDTGTDTDHQSFDAAAFQYSLAHQAGLAGMEIEAYMEHIDLLDVDEIASVLDQLHIAERGSFTAEELYVSTKLPFGFNYVDSDLDLTHDNDSMSEHGSHVAGIAAANAYIPNGDGTFSLALDKVLVQGVAPDAQIITQKVFGKNGGAYSSDYMAAMEDAIVLGCDAINLSLGSSQPGFAAIDSAYEHMVQQLMDSGVVISISAGNAYSWPEYAYNGGYLYSDDVNMHTGGSPGTWPIAFTVASAENVGYTRGIISLLGSTIFSTRSPST